jgi:hypothetical protein
MISIMWGILLIILFEMTIALDGMADLPEPKN